DSRRLGITVKTAQYPIEIPGIQASSQLADGMHGKCRHPDIQRLDTHFRSGQRTDGAATFHIGARYEALHGYLSLVAQHTENRAGLAVGGIALISIDLDNGAAIEQGTVVFIMAVTEVGVDAMGI